MSGILHLCMAGLRPGSADYSGAMRKICGGMKKERREPLFSIDNKGFYWIERAGPSNGRLAARIRGGGAGLFPGKPT
ncbi:hypothetical protein O4J55_22255, partial [Paracoccus sp. PXZ]